METKEVVGGGGERGEGRGRNEVDGAKRKLRSLSTGRKLTGANRWSEDVLAGGRVARRKKEEEKKMGGSRRLGWDAGVRKIGWERNREINLSWVGRGERKRRVTRVC